MHKIHRRKNDEGGRKEGKDKEVKGKGRSSKGTLELSMVGITVLLVLTTIAVTFLAVTPVTVVAQPVEVRVTPETPELGYIEEGAPFTVTIDIKDVTDLSRAQFDLSFDSSVAKVRDVKRDIKDGKIDGVDVPIFMCYDIDADTVRVIASMPIGESVSGSGYLTKIEFVAIGDEGDESVLDISEGSLFDKEGPGGWLFWIDEEFKDELNDEEISDELKEIFEDKGYPLETPTVKVIKKDEKWKIIDETEIYVVITKENVLKIKDTGEIPAKWVDAEIRIGEDEEEEEEVDEEVTQGSPNITAWKPAEAVVSNAVGESRTFNITVNQIADISWQITGTEVQTNETVTEAVYTNMSAVIGTWNVSAIATNTTTGLSEMHTWIWNVTLTPTATVTPTPTPTLAPGVTSAPEAEGTPTSQEKEPVTKETPTPKQEVPGFEAVFAIAVMLGLGIVYILQRRR
jgi:hypothetical protein